MKFGIRQEQQVSERSINPKDMARETNKLIIALRQLWRKYSDGLVDNQSRKRKALNSKLRGGVGEET